MTSSLLYPPGNIDYHLHGYHDLSTGQYIGYQIHSDYLRPLPSYDNSYSFPQSQYYAHPRIMAAPINPQDMDDFQRLSDDYRADLPGPLIGDKLPMSVLATEYAQADATYVVKTAALAQTYSAYRTVKGDGQCGWRGAVFGYFETLLQLGDLDVLQQERVRIQSFEDTMRMAGIDYDIIIDMFDFTWELFDELQKAVERQDKSDAVLLDALNNEVKSDSIVYHFKMMTSAFMQLRSDQYEPFLEVPIAEYRVSRIDPSNQEIDQIGLQALTDAVIAPANFALEVLYLDRSMGEEVTPHPFVASPEGKPTIRLLYRPGHYDMIYKEQHDVQVFYQKESLVPQYMDMAAPSNTNSDIQAYLFPGPQEFASHPSGSSSSFYDMDQGTDHSTKNHQYIYSPYPQPTCLMPIDTSFGSTASAQSDISMPGRLNLDFSHSTPHPLQYPVSPCSSTDASASSPYLATTAPSLPTRRARPSSPPVSLSKEISSGPQIRLNANCFNYALRHESVPLCSQTYGSAAALSTAHFRNQDFQPQMWRAEEEYFKS